MATDNKYDRQLRLWGASGQRALSETAVLLVRATAAGTETVKNLVLPGAGSFCVVDDDHVVYDDENENETDGTMTSNFFLTKPASAVGNNHDNDSDKNNSNKRYPRAQVATENLQELNPDVRGSYAHTDSLLQFDYAKCMEDLVSNSSSTSTTTKVLVVAADLEPAVLNRVSRRCRERNAPLVAVWSYGLLGIVRLQSPPAALLQPKPRDAVPDLRLVTPFDGLAELSASVKEWDDMDDKEHGHVPYPLILLRVAEQYKSQHDGQLPTSVREKEDFKAAVKAAAREYENEMNFQEAADSAYLAYSERVLDTDHLKNVQSACANGVCPVLHHLLQALFQFLERNGNRPPLQGTIPDMTSSTDLYVKLQQTYREQADRDWREMKSLLAASACTTVTDEELTLFCQNLHAVDLFSTRTIQEEYGAAADGAETAAVPAEIVEDLSMALFEAADEEQKDQTPLLWYLCFRACQLFYQEHGGRYPGASSLMSVSSSAAADDDAANDNDNVANGVSSTTTDNNNNNNSNSYREDVPKLEQCLKRVLGQYGGTLQDHDVIQQTLLSPSRCADYCTEMTRYGAAEVHAVAAVVGGVASQEAVKLITGQYVPIDNTYVYNGISSTGAVYRF